MNKLLRFLPLAAILLLYFGGLFQRPLFAPDEFHYAAGARYYASDRSESRESAEPALLQEYPNETLRPALVHRLNGRAVALFGAQPWTLRLLPALATLLTAGVLLLFGRLRSPAQGVHAALIYLGTLAVFAVGTSASSIPLLVLGVVAVVLGTAGTVLVPRREFWYFPVIAVAGLGLLLGLHDLAGAPDFRRIELLGLLVVGLLPTLILAPVILRGVRGTPWREPGLLTTGIGLAAALLLGIFQPAAGVMAALAFAATPAAYGFNRCAEMDPEGRRLNRLLRSFILLAGVMAVGFLVLQMLGKFEKIPSQYIIYDKFSSGLIATFALMVMLFWWIWALKEPRSCQKLYGLLLGFGFVMLAGQQLLPSEVVRRQALQKPLELFIGDRVTPETVIIADSVCAPAAYWTFGEIGKVLCYPESADGAARAAEYIDSMTESSIIVLRRDREEELLTNRPQRKIYFRPAGLSIQEFF